MIYAFCFFVLLAQLDGFHAVESDRLVSLGGSREGSRTVEVTDLGSKNNAVCRLANLPEDVWGHSAIYTNRGIIFCGGITREGRSKKCHILDANGSWLPFHDLTQPGYQFSMVKLNEKIVVIGSSYTGNSFEFINIQNGSNWDAKSFTLKPSSHCTVAISETTVMIIGGILVDVLPNQVSSGTTFLNVNTMDSAQGPFMNEARFAHGCATASYNGSLHVFVVGGKQKGENRLSSMEVFNINEERWIDDFRSSNLPVPLSHFQVVQANSPKYFVYAVGGRAPNHPNQVSTIYGLNYSKQWEKIGDLESKRYSHATINIGSHDIPDCQFYCSWSSWQSWSACSKPCGGGEHRKKRINSVVEKSNGTCSEKSTEWKLCNEQGCEVGFVEYKNKSCYEGTYGTRYDEIEVAQAACLIDSNCQGVWDLQCRGNYYFLCSVAATYEYSESNCGFEKIEATHTSTEITTTNLTTTTTTPQIATKLTLKTESTTNYDIKTTDSNITTSKQDNWTTTDEPAETTTEETFSTETTKMTSAFNVATSNKATTIDYLLSSDCLNDEIWCEEAGPDCRRDFTKMHCRRHCQLCFDVCQWSDWSSGLDGCNTTKCGPHYVSKTRRSISDGPGCMSQTIREDCPLNDCSKFFNTKGEEEDKTLEVVSSIPATLLDDCGNEYEFNISLKCNDVHDVNETKIESTCSYSVPDVPICNKTTTGNIEWTKWESWGKCSSSCFSKPNSLPIMTRIRNDRMNESLTQIQQSVCQNLTICPAECPTLLATLHPQSKLASRINLQITKAAMPFMKVVRQDVLLSFTPINNLMAKEHNSYDRIYFATWNETDDFEESKSIEDLPIDENFDTTIRIMFKQMGFISSNENVYITVDCPSNQINTSLWFCKNKQQIYAGQICNGEKNCADESDERPEMCKGTNIKLLVIMKSVCISFLALGYLLFSTLSFGTKIILKDKVSDDCHFSQDEIDCCKLIFTVCKKVATRTNEKSCNDADSNDFREIVEKYKYLHKSGSFKLVNFLHTSIKNLALDNSLTSTCMLLSSHLITLELKGLHDDPKTGNESMKKMLLENWRTSSFMIEAKERNGIISKTLTAFKQLLPKSIGNNVGFIISISIILINLIVKPTLPYYDFLADLALSITMNHIKANFVTSEAKARAVSHINLDTNAYYFFLLNTLSIGIMAKYCMINFPIIKSYKESILMSASSRGSNLLLLIYSIFPYHALAFEIMNIFYCKIKREQEIRNLLGNMIEQDNHKIEEDIHLFLKLQNELESTFVAQSKVNKIMVGCGLIITFFENIPQVIVLLSLLHSELNNRFGRLGVLMENVMHTYLRSVGIPNGYAFITIMTINITQVCLSLIPVISSRKYGLDLGIIGGVLKVLSILIMLLAKLVLLTCQLYQSPYFYGFVVVAEFAISYLFCSVTQIQVDIIDDVIPIAICPALYVTTNRVTLNHENSNGIFHNAVKWNGAISIVFLHFINLLLIYLPLIYVFPAFQAMIGQQVEENYQERLFAMIAYCCVIFPFVGLLFAHHKVGRRWSQLEA